MNCPVCNSSSSVLDGRFIDDHYIRRRKCKSCGYVWCTEEIDSNRGDKELRDFHNERNKKRYRQLKEATL